MDFDLDHLKHELLDYLAAEGFAVFRSQPDALSDFPAIYWDTEAHPEYQRFLSAAKTAGATLILFTHRELDSEEIDDTIEELEECDLAPSDRRPIERSLDEMREHIGSTGSLEMAFDHQGRLYVYKLTTDWFQTFSDLQELLMGSISTETEEDDEDEHGSFGGYYSKN